MITFNKDRDISALRYMYLEHWDVSPYLCYNGFNK